MPILDPSQPVTRALLDLALDEVREHELRWLWRVVYFQGAAIALLWLVLFAMAVL